MVVKFNENKVIEPSVNFLQKQTGKIFSDIWEQLEQGLWKDIKPENYEYNVIQGLLNRPNWKPVLKDILPLYLGMKWCEEKKQIEDPYFIPEKKDTGLKDFLNAAEIFFGKYSGGKIGVQLSGGLDSSIIIGVMRYLGIPFSLVGMSTTRYEFRTERHIQKLLTEWGNAAVLIDYEAHLPFFDLNNVPPFQYPDMLCLNYSADQAMALKCEKLDIDILLTGNGGDNVFADEVPLNPEDCIWRPQIFMDALLMDIVYAPKGVKLVPFFADKRIIESIYNLRLGQPEDNSKLWARNFFKDFLPQELVNYTYCADFWGLYIDGLQSSLPIVRELCARAYELTQNPCFSVKVINELLNQDLLNAKKDMYQIIEARITLAAWLNALIK